MNSVGPIPNPGGEPMVYDKATLDKARQTIKDFKSSANNSRVHVDSKGQYRTAGRFFAWLATTKLAVISRLFQGTGQIGDKTLDTFIDALNTLYGERAAAHARAQINEARVSSFGLGKSSITKMERAAQGFKGAGAAVTWSRNATLRFFKQPDSYGHTSLYLKDRSDEKNKKSTYMSWVPASNADPNSSSAVNYNFKKYHAAAAMKPKVEKTAFISKDTNEKLNKGEIARKILKKLEEFKNLKSGDDDINLVYGDKEKLNKEILSLIEQGGFEVKGYSIDAERTGPDSVEKRTRDVFYGKLTEAAKFKPRTNQEIVEYETNYSQRETRWGLRPEKICIPMMGPNSERSFDPKSIPKNFANPNAKQNRKMYVMFGLKESAIKKAWYNRLKDADISEEGRPNDLDQVPQVGFRMVSNEYNCASTSIAMLKEGGAQHFAKEPRGMIYFSPAEAADYAERIQKRTDSLNGTVFFVHAAASNVRKNSPDLREAECAFKILGDDELSSELAKQTGKTSGKLKNIARHFESLMKLKDGGDLDAYIEGSISVVDSMREEVLTIQEEAKKLGDTTTDQGMKLRTRMLLLNEMIVRMEEGMQGVEKRAQEEPKQPRTVSAQVSDRSVLETFRESSSKCKKNLMRKGQLATQAAQDGKITAPSAIIEPVDLKNQWNNFALRYTQNGEDYRNSVLLKQNDKELDKLNKALTLNAGMNKWLESMNSQDGDPKVQLHLANSLLADIETIETESPKRTKNTLSLPPEFHQYAALCLDYIRQEVIKKVIPKLLDQEHTIENKSINQNDSTIDNKSFRGELKYPSGTSIFDIEN